MTIELANPVRIPMHARTQGGFSRLPLELQPLPPEPPPGSPEIISASVNGGTLEVTGINLGEKSPPKLVDYVEFAYENANINTFFSSYDDMQLITQADMQSNEDAVWTSEGTSGMGATYIQRVSDVKRYPEKAAHYFGATAKSSLHNPRVWNTSGTPTTETKLHVSWWFWQANDTRYYFRFTVSEVAENFNPTENDTFIVDVGPHWSGVTEVEGRVVAWDPDTNTIDAIFWNQNNNSRILGRTVTLDSNGATCVLQTGLDSQGSNKFIRLREKSETEGFKLSWTQMQLGAFDGNNYNRANVPEKEWCRMDIFVDTETRSILTKVNGIQQGPAIQYTNDVGVEGHSPTIGLIGFDASVGVLQNIYIDEVYLDTDFRRLVLSNSPVWDETLPYEIQPVSSWGDEAIAAPIHLGALGDGPKYAYIIDINSSVNSTGIEVQI